MGNYLYGGAENMYEDMKGNPKMVEEYEETFDSEERVSNAIKVTNDEFTIDLGVVDFEDIIVPDPIKKSRKETFLGLSTSIAEMGILQPIHVMVSEGYAEWVEEGSEGEFEGFKYILLDGFRRIWGGYKNGLTRCNAVIWNFKDKDKGNDLALVLSMILNKGQQKSYAEIWYLYQLLESQSALTPGTIEYLLQLQPGDAMKLKDIMSCEYPEVIDALLSKKKDINGAYNMLQKARKEEDQLIKDDNTGISDMEQADGVVDKAGDRMLSDSEISEILEMDTSGELAEGDFDETFKGDLEAEVERQKVGERHPISRELKAETMLRDNYTCQCCGIGDGLPMLARLSILQSHHKISVANQGPDTAENIITVCMSCHTLIHVVLKNKMKFGMSKETFDAMSDDNKRMCERIMQVAKKDWEAGKRLGKNADQISAENKDFYKFKMPGSDLAENRKAYVGGANGKETA